MDFFKVKKFRKARKPNLQEDLEEKPIPHPEGPNNENGNGNLSGKSVAMDNARPDVEDDDDDDFITNEVKRRLKELRRNSFMVLIPEEEGGEGEDEEEEGETSSSEGRDIGSQVEHLYCDFESIYEKYCERMLFFDRMSSQQLNVSVWLFLPK
ncbi:Pheromone-regulated membrane protein 10 [Bienertia sinuspersici]